MEQNEMQMIQGMFESLMMEMRSFKEEVNGKFEEVNGKFEEVNGKFEEVNGRLDKLDEKVTRIDVTIENEIRTNIKLLAEGQETINRKLDQLADVPERLENLEIHVGAISPTVHKHSIKLKKL